MIPIVLDPAVVPLGLAGRGAVAARRLAGLQAAGAATVEVFSDEPTPALAAQAGSHLRRGLPDDRALTRLRLLWIADLPRPQAAGLAARARALGVLVNVEDDKPLCDFHNPARVQRGDLLLTVSTGGRSPGLASRLRRHLEERFGEAWRDRLDRLATLRAAWQFQGRSPEECARLTDSLIDAEGWLR